GRVEVGRFQQVGGRKTVRLRAHSVYPLKPRIVHPAVTKAPFRRRRRRNQRTCLKSGLASFYFARSGLSTSPRRSRAGLYRNGTDCAFARPNKLIVSLIV